MDEPSVLDYLKDKLSFWKESTLLIPPQDDLLEEKSGMGKSGTTNSAWKSVLPLVPALFAITAQIFSEPEDRSYPLVIFFYILAGIGFLLLIFFMNWKLDPLEKSENEAGQYSFKLTYFVIGSVSSVLAFLFFQDNRFNGINLTLWIIGLGFVWRSFWVPEDWSTRIRSAWDKFWQDGLKITSWKVLVGLVFLITVFYRFYMLDQIPPEMFSDHAEKLIDVSDVLNGNLLVFFPRNTGREAFQIYLTAAIARLFGTGISFTSLKIGTCLAGLFTLPFIYLLGKEIKDKQVGLMAMFFAGIAYWPNVLSRVGLRFVLYPAFVAPTLYFLIKGLKRKRWNDFLLAGLFLGLGLHGYSPFRIVPFAVILIMLVYLLHTRSKNNRRMVVTALLLVGLISLIVFLPLGRFALSNPNIFSYRMLTRMTAAERPLPGPALNIFFSNLWKSLIMFQWDNGEIWVHSVSSRPALGIITAAFFSLGLILLVVRYFKHRCWIDLVLLLAVPILMLPSVLSLAFPVENPSLNRSAGSLIPVFLIVALAIENFMTNLRSNLPESWGKWFSTGIVILVALVSMRINYQLVFEDYYQQYRIRSWNSSEIGGMIRQFSDTIGDEDQAWVVPFPHWVDTRLVGIQALGYVREYGLWPSDLSNTLQAPLPKLIIYKPGDQDAIQTLKELYPDGFSIRYDSEVEGRDFMLYYVLK